MKKQIIFYVAWEVLFWVALYGLVTGSYMMKVYVGRTMNSFPVLWANIGLLVLLGGVLCLLVFVSGRFQHTIRSAVAEFVLIGIPALYIATAFLIVGLFYGMGVANIHMTVPWLYRTELPMEIGSILFGYELFLLIARILQLRKAAKPVATEEGIRC